MMSKVLVVSADSMQDEIFLRHMRYRHEDALGRFTTFIHTSSYVTGVWRTHHDEIHYRHTGLDHEHEERTNG